MHMPNRRRAVPAALLVALAATGCLGGPTPPSNVNATSAQLNGKASCDASSTTNPCEFFFQYWAHGSTTPPMRTPVRVHNVRVVDGPVKETVSGLAPGTLYHYQLCGKGDQNVTSTVCTGPGNSSGNRPGEKPTNLPEGASSFRTANAAANPSANATVALGRPANTWEATTKFGHSSDVGDSASYGPGKAMWIFGDTGIFNADHKMVGFVTGNTGATATYSPGDPSTLELSPIDTGQASASGWSRITAAGDGSVCPSGEALRWPQIGSGAPGRVIVSYNDVCRGDAQMTARASGLAEYDPAAKRFTSPQCTAFKGNPLPAQQILGSPIRAGDGFVYAYAVHAGSVYVAKVAEQPSAWCTASNFTWWNGSTWQADPLKALSIAPTNNVGDANVEDFRSVKGGFVMTVREYYSTKFRVFTAPAPRGPWTPGAAGELPESCEGGAFKCYAMVSHPELSSSSSLTYSWYSPDDLGRHGHIRMGSMAW